LTMTRFALRVLLLSGCGSTRQGLASGAARWGSMVVKTDTCAYSGLRIYPGHGIFYVRADQKSFKFLNRKSKSQFLQRLNPRKIAWTQLYRRMHKKGTMEESARKKARLRSGMPGAAPATGQPTARSASWQAEGRGLGLRGPPVHMARGGSPGSTVEVDRFVVAAIAISPRASSVQHRPPRGYWRSQPCSTCPFLLD
jgi:large subunit ribosomal protein L24e